MQLKKEFFITRGDSLAITDVLTDKDGKPIDILNLHLRAHFKTFKNYKTNEVLFELNSLNNEILKYENGIYKILIKPEDSWSLVPTKDSKPVIIGLSIFNEDDLYRKEIQYGLNVRQNIVNQLY